MKWGKALPVLLVFLFAASTSFASGFRLPEEGAKAMGMGFAFTAQADDPSAIYYNPAGLTQLDGTNLMVGGTFVMLSGPTFTGSTPITGATKTAPGTVFEERQKTLEFMIPNMYIARTDKDSGISYGVGIFTPFGLAQQYKDPFTSIFRDQITRIDLKTFVLNPSIAFKIDEVLSVGFGIDYMYGKANLQKTPFSPVVDGATGNGNLYTLELDGDGDAWGFNVGVLVKPTDNLRIGANFRSGFDLNLKNGDVAIRNQNAFYGTGMLGLTPADTHGTAIVSIPATFAIGVAYTMGKLTVEADADWTFWSAYNNLPIDINVNSTTTPTLRDSENVKNWENVCALRFGAEYKVTDPLALRVGFAYDPSPVPGNTIGPELPDSDRLNYTVGAGYKTGPWTIDVAFMYIDKQDRKVSNVRDGEVPGTLVGMNGEWEGDAWLTALNVGYKF